MLDFSMYRFHMKNYDSYNNKIWTDDLFPFIVDLLLLKWICLIIEDYLKFLNNIYWLLWGKILAVELNNSVKYSKCFV